MITDEKYYTCKNDKAFKYLFLNEKNKNLLKSLLESILNEKIDKITLLPTEQVEDTIKTKNKTVDALIEIKDKIIGIEVNSSEYKGLRVRNMAYISNIYSSNVEVGDDYIENIMIMQINLTYGMKEEKEIREYYVQDKEEKKYVSNFKIIEVSVKSFGDFYEKSQKIGNEIINFFNIQENIFFEQEKQFHKFVLRQI